jgi:hypothetical protein
LFIKINYSFFVQLLTSIPILWKNDPNTRDVIADNLIRMLMLGPEVSFNGSPTVSPTTAALCASECLTKVYFPFEGSSSPKTSLAWLVPASMYFLALSQAPPVFEKEIAIYTPLTMIPASNPETPCTPNNIPTIKGDPITSMPGAIIFLREADVEI